MSSKSSSDKDKGNATQNGKAKVRQSLSAQFLADVQALADYAPRAQAIAWIKEGRLDAFMDWADHDGFIAACGPEAMQPESELRRLDTLFNPLMLDVELVEGRLGRKINDRLTGKALDIANQAIECFDQSPFEMAIRADSDTAFEAIVALLATPKCRFADSAGDLALRARFIGHRARHILLKDGSREAIKMLSGHCWDMLILAHIVGKPNRAERMVRLGLAPSDQNEWSSFSDRLDSFAKLDAKQLAEIAGVERAQVEQADEWAREKLSLSEDLEELFYEAIPKLGDPKASEFDAKLDALLQKGAPIGYFPLAQATAAGRLDMLRKLFAAGGNPNAKYKTGVPMLARLEGPELSVEALQIWLDAGARPTMPPGSEQAFGGGWCPSPLYQFAWAGRLDLIKLCFETAQGKTNAVEEREGQSYCPMLAIALNKGHGDLAAWLIEEQGARLEHLDPESGETCKDLSAPGVLSQALAAQERLDFRTLPVPPGGYSKSSRRGPI